MAPAVASEEARAAEQVEASAPGAATAEAQGSAVELAPVAAGDSAVVGARAAAAASVTGSEAGPENARMHVAGASVGPCMQGDVRDARAMGSKAINLGSLRICE